MSKIYIGAKFTNKQNATFTVIEKTDIPHYWVVAFDSGYTTTAKDSNIPYGKVKDYFTPTVYGKGYLGSACRIPQRGDSLMRKKYDLWANMLKRTSGKYREKSTYFNVQVTPEWLNFSIFQIEIESVEGYDAWLNDTKMCLDKDLTQQKLYSRATCKFITASENTLESLKRRWEGSGS
jgi:hypothetical protein